MIMKICPFSLSHPTGPKECIGEKCMMYNPNARFFFGSVEDKCQLRV